MIKPNKKKIKFKELFLFIFQYQFKKEKTNLKTNKSNQTFKKQTRKFFILSLEYMLLIFLFYIDRIKQ
jgi:hypothetical protein